VATRWILGLSFIAMAGWMLIPDKLDDDQAGAKLGRFGVFGATTVAFFLAEMADKTQIATIALAARFDSLAAVVIGTTLGMMIANVPAVMLGEVAAKKLPKRTCTRWPRWCSRRWGGRLVGRGARPFRRPLTAHRPNAARASHGRRLRYTAPDAARN